MDGTIITLVRDFPTHPPDQAVPRCVFVDEKKGTIDILPVIVTPNGYGDWMTFVLEEGKYAARVFAVTPANYSFYAHGLPPGMMFEKDRAVVHGTPRMTGTYFSKVAVYDEEGHHHIIVVLFTIISGAVATGPRPIEEEVWEEDVVEIPPREPPAPAATPTAHPPTTPAGMATVMEGKEEEEELEEFEPLAQEAYEEFLDEKHEERDEEEELPPDEILQKSGVTEHPHPEPGIEEPPKKRKKRSDLVDSEPIPCDPLDSLFKLDVRMTYALAKPLGEGRRSRNRHNVLHNYSVTDGQRWAQLAKKAAENFNTRGLDRLKTTPEMWNEGKNAEGVVQKEIQGNRSSVHVDFSNTERLREIHKTLADDNGDAMTVVKTISPETIEEYDQMLDKLTMEHAPNSVCSALFRELLKRLLDPCALPKRKKSNWMERLALEECAMWRETLIHATAETLLSMPISMTYDYGESAIIDDSTYPKFSSDFNIIFYIIRDCVEQSTSATRSKEDVGKLRDDPTGATWPTSWSEEPFVLLSRMRYPQVKYLIVKLLMKWLQLMIDRTEPVVVAEEKDFSKQTLSRRNNFTRIWLGAKYRWKALQSVIVMRGGVTKEMTKIEYKEMKDAIDAADALMKEVKSWSTSDGKFDKDKVLASHHFDDFETITFEEVKSRKFPAMAPDDDNKDSWIASGDISTSTRGAGPVIPAHVPPPAAPPPPPAPSPATVVINVTATPPATTQATVVDPATIQRERELYNVTPTPPSSPASFSPATPATPPTQPVITLSQPQITLTPPLSIPPTPPFSFSSPPPKKRLDFGHIKPLTPAGEEKKISLNLRTTPLKRRRLQPASTPMKEAQGPVHDIIKNLAMISPSESSSSQSEGLGSEPEMSQSPSPSPPPVRERAYYTPSPPQEAPPLTGYRPVTFTPPTIPSILTAKLEKYPPNMKLPGEVRKEDKGIVNSMIFFNVFPFQTEADLGTTGVHDELLEYNRIRLEGAALEWGGIKVIHGRTTLPNNLAEARERWVQAWREDMVTHIERCLSAFQNLLMASDPEIDFDQVHSDQNVLRNMAMEQLKKYTIAHITERTEVREGGPYEMHGDPMRKTFPSHEAR